jgi:DNA (cytosine-5)-methyltransferase 1
VKHLTAIDLFSGVGGLSLGFQQQGIEIEYANEYDPGIANSYAKNHQTTNVDSRDITKIDISKTFSPYRNRISIVMGGPPCQGFSQKGKRIGLDDERNYMFKYFFEVINTVDPDVAILENVPNIISAYDGKFTEQILTLFDKMGFEVDFGLLNAEEFGVPQIRRRAFFLAARRGRLSKIDLPIPTNLRTTVHQAISDLPRLNSGEGQEVSSYHSEPDSRYQKIMRRHSKQLHNHVATNHSKLALERLSHIDETQAMLDLPIELQTKSIYSGTWSRIPRDGFARTITTRFDTPSSGQFTLYDQDRCLTVREAARIQSFPDTYIFHGNKSSQMLQVGNAVPPILGAALAKEILANY